VVTVDPDAGKAEATGPLIERNAGLPLRWLGNRPLVVLAEKHDRRIVHRRPAEGLAHVSTAGGPITEIGDGGLAVLTECTVPLDAHRVAGGVQRLAADHDRVVVEPVLLRIPATVADAAEKPEQRQRVHITAPGDAMLAISRKGEILRAH